MRRWMIGSRVCTSAAFGTASQKTSICVGCWDSETKIRSRWLTFMSPRFVCKVTD